MSKHIPKTQHYFPIKKSTAIMFDAAFMMAKYSKYLLSLDKIFRAEVMLAVTAVNGCRICNVYHSKDLKKSAAKTTVMPAINLDMNAFLKPAENKESLALNFATHYATVGGKYDCDIFQKLIDYYGKKEAYGIMASIKVITFGNVNGISLGNLADRIRFRKVSNAKFLTDLYNGILAYLLLPIFVIINLFRRRKAFECA